MTDLAKELEKWRNDTNPLAQMPSQNNEDEKLTLAENTKQGERQNQENKKGL